MGGRREAGGRLGGAPLEAEAQAAGVLANEGVTSGSGGRPLLDAVQRIRQEVRLLRRSAAARAAPRLARAAAICAALMRQRRPRKRGGTTGEPADKDTGRGGACGPARALRAVQAGQGVGGRPVPPRIKRQPAGRRSEWRRGLPRCGETDPRAE